MKILVIGGTGYVGLRERPLERDGCFSNRPDIAKQDALAGA
jgi:hypothetical protein